MQVWLRMTDTKMFARLARRYSTPKKVQDLIKALEYNREDKGETLRSAAMVMKHKTAHCFEAAILAAAILEQKGYPPLVVSLESQDFLDHVIYVFQEKGVWGSIGHSRDEGLHGRPPKYRSIRDLVLSYIDEYVDKTGRITGYQVANLEDMGVDWRFGRRHLWKAERYLIALPHHKIRTSDTRYRRIHRRYMKEGNLPWRSYWW